ncbi:MAG: glycosyltransferase family 9 protein [Verrucomicrobia bacterium]|nr:glycosyltransferase family 9 protein [Verrucomicrobiota bacterium]
MAFLREQRRAMGRGVVRAARAVRDVLLGMTPLPTPTAMPEHVLIIRPFFLGDILLCLPAAQAIKRLNPRTRITWLLHEEYADLIRGHSVVDEVIPFSGSKMHGAAVFREFWRVARELRARAFDLALNLTWDRSSMMWTWISEAPVRLGIEEYGRPRLVSLVHTATVVAPERSGDRQHMADFYYAPLRLLGFEERKELPQVSPTAEEREDIALRLATALGSDASNETPPFFLIHPGGRLSHKRWPLERFAELICALGRQGPQPIILTCGPGEESWAASLAESLPPGRGWFWPSPSLGEFMALATRADCFIGNDSAPMHMAAACGCRVIAIFGNDPVRWAPLGNGHRIVGGIAGLESVTVRNVLDAVSSLSAKSRGESRNTQRGVAATNGTKSLTTEDTEDTEG